MSIRTLVELDHDYCPNPRDDEQLLKWARGVAKFMISRDEKSLPTGVERKWSRHHSDPCPYDNPLEFERQFPRRTGATKKARNN